VTRAQSSTRALATLLTVTKARDRASDRESGPGSGRSGASTTPRITGEPYGRTGDGVQVERFTLESGGGMRVRVLTYGAIVQSVEVPDRHGNLANVALGFADLAGYLADNPFFGAIIGRYANRIAGAGFTLDGRAYRLAANDGPNTLHGGNRGFDRRVWRAEPAKAAEAAGGAGEVDGVGLRLTYVSADGEEGFPGTMTATVTYTVTTHNELRIDYRAGTDRPTVVNLTNHSYFNLAGEGAGDVYGHLLRVHADRYLPVDDTRIPTGELAPVAGTPFDFTGARPIGEDIRSGHPQLALARGYDHTFVINHDEPHAAKQGGTEHSGAKESGAERGGGEEGGAEREGRHAPVPAAEVEEPGSGRIMRVLTTEPGMQVPPTAWTADSSVRAGAPIGRATGCAWRPSTSRTHPTGPPSRPPGWPPARSTARPRCTRSRRRVERHPRPNLRHHCSTQSPSAQTSITSCRRLRRRHRRRTNRRRTRSSRRRSSSRHRRTTRRRRRTWWPRPCA
jgi:aldose 1-epimerase